MKMLKQGSVVNPTIIFQCSVCKSVFSANVNELEAVGFSSTNCSFSSSDVSQVTVFPIEIMYRFRCPVCGMERYAINRKEDNNDNHQ